MTLLKLIIAILHMIYEVVNKFSNIKVNNLINILFKPFTSSVSVLQHYLDTLVVMETIQSGSTE